MLCWRDGVAGMLLLFEKYFSLLALRCRAFCGGGNYTLITKYIFHFIIHFK